FAQQHGLLPPSPPLTRAFRYVRLETGLAAGAALVLVGVFLSAREVARWGSVGFGDMDVGHTMRAVMVAAIALTLGIQTIFASFFLSVLGLAVRPSGPTA